MRYRRKSSLFLIELIIAILFFTLSATVCVKLFSASFLITQEIEYRDTAILQAQSVAEQFRNDQGDVTTILSAYQGEEVGEDLYICKVDTDEGVYQILLETMGTADLPKLYIAVIPPNSEETIIELCTQIYIPYLEEEGI